MKVKSKWQIHAYAIVCQRDCIADADGKLPEVLKNDYDWEYFQNELDTCGSVILGRRAHELAPNISDRMRVVMSSQSSGLERRADAWWWNPQSLHVEEMLQSVQPGGGKVGVPGGQGAFDYFLGYGINVFHLSRVENVILNGKKLLSQIAGDSCAEWVFRRRGLSRRSLQMLDPSGPVTLSIWQSI